MLRWRNLLAPLLALAHREQRRQGGPGVDRLGDVHPGRVDLIIEGESLLDARNRVKQNKILLNRLASVVLVELTLQLMQMNALLAALALHE